MKKTISIKKLNNNNRNYYRIWFNDLLINRYIDTGSGYFSSFTDYAKKCIFKLDLTFDQNRINQKKEILELSDSSYDIEHDNFLLIYNHIAEALYGRRFSRPHNVTKSPYVISCIDFEGSRFASSTTLGSRNPHIHSVWAVRPEDIEPFLAITNKVTFHLRFADKLDIDCPLRFERYKSSLSTVAGLASYATKTQFKTTKNGLGGELLRIYPNLNFSPNGKTYNASRQYQRLSRNLDRRRLEMSSALASLNREREPWEWLPPKVRTDNLDEFLAAEPLLRVDLESAQDMLATLDGKNSGPYMMKPGNGIKPTVVKGATGNVLIVRGADEFSAFRKEVEKMASVSTKVDPSSNSFT